MNNPYFDDKYDEPIYKFSQYKCCPMEHPDVTSVALKDAYRQWLLDMHNIPFKSTKIKGCRLMGTLSTFENELTFG